jgi:magnesium-transporting ATPase (P-type)
MATGDNTLTAIAVGRESNILERDEVVYFCDIENERLVWNSTKNEYD